MTLDQIVYWLSAWTVVSVVTGVIFGLIMCHKGANNDAPRLPEPATRQ